MALSLRYRSVEVVLTLTYASCLGITRQNECHGTFAEF